MFAGVAGSEHAWCARTEYPQGAAEFDGPRAVGRPRHGDDGGARVRGGVLGEGITGQDALVIGMSERAEQGRIRGR